MSQLHSMLEMQQSCNVKGPHCENCALYCSTCSASSGLLDLFDSSTLKIQGPDLLSGIRLRPPTSTKSFVFSADLEGHQALCFLVWQGNVLPQLVLCTLVPREFAVWVRLHP